MILMMGEGLDDEDLDGKWGINHRSQIHAWH